MARVKISHSAFVVFVQCYENQVPVAIISVKAIRILIFCSSLAAIIRAIAFIFQILFAISIVPDVFM